MGVRISSLTAIAEAVATNDLLALVNVSESSDKTKKATIAQVRSAIVPIVEADQSLSDVTTLDVSTSKHGYVPKAPNDTAKFLRGDGTWSVGPSDRYSTLTSTPVSISNTNTTLTLRKFHVVTATSSAVTITMPSSPAAGDVVGVLIDSTSTKLVTVSGTISGVSSKILWAGEAFEAVYDGSAWRLLTYTACAMACVMHAATSQTGGNNGNYNWITCKTVETDNTGLMADTTNGYPVCKRNGLYYTQASAQTAGTFVYTACMKNSTSVASGTILHQGYSTYLAFSAKPVDLVSGDYISLMVWSNGVAVTGNTNTNLAMMEAPKW